MCVLDVSVKVEMCVCVCGGRHPRDIIARLA